MIIKVIQMNHQNGTRRNTQAGFTLIELIIAVAIVGILSAIAYPSYQEYVRRSNRADAKTALLENAQFLEQLYTECNRYDKKSDSDDDNDCGDEDDLEDADLPVQNAPRDSAALYSISATTLTTDTYTLTATPVVGQRMAGDACGNFTLTELGAKSVSGTYTPEQCWGK